jgi:hypothetical protein
MLDGMWKEARDTFELAVRYREQPGPPVLSSSVFSTLSFALGSYSAQVVRMHREDAAAAEFAERGLSEKKSGFCEWLLYTSLVY